MLLFHIVLPVAILGGLGFRMRGLTADLVTCRDSRIIWVNLIWVISAKRFFARKCWRLAGHCVGDIGDLIALHIVPTVASFRRNGPLFFRGHRNFLRGHSSHGSNARPVGKTIGVAPLPIDQADCFSGI